MPVRRLLLALLACAALGGALAGRAAAITPPLPGCVPGPTNSVTTAHFAVWYNSDPQHSDYITESQANDIGGWAEDAYSYYTSLGFPVPATDLSGKTDIYVMDLTSPWDVFSVTCPATPGSFDFNADTTNSSDRSMFTIAQNVFAQIEYTQFPSLDPTTDMWLTQGASQWAAARSLSYPAVAADDIGPPDMSLDCWDPQYTTGLTKCSKDYQYEGMGYSRWPFYEFLAETYGPTFIDQVLADAQGASAPKSYNGLAAALAARGSSVAAAWSAYATMDLTGGYTAPGLAHLVPSPSAQVLTGTSATTVVSKLRIPVDHLATRYVEFDRGDGTGANACFVATLNLTVTFPAGLTTQPTFFWTGTGGTATPLTVSGSTATASIPWDTCTWIGSVGMLSLPNASSNPDVNSANFYVTATVAIADPAVPANSGAPPPAASVWGQVVPVTSATLPPAITLLSKEVLTLSPTDRTLYLVVESGGEGSVQASIGSVSLGTVTVTPGENQLTFTLPASALDALRRSAGTASLLSVTPVATNGAVSGQAQTRKVVLQPAVKKTAKSAAKPKAKAKKKHRK